MSPTESEGTLNRSMIALLLVVLATPAFADVTADMSALSRRVDSVEQQLSTSDQRLHAALEDYDRIKKVLSDYQMLDSRIANYLTLVSILATVVVVGIPLVNYFAVLRPNRRLRRRLSHLETNIMSKVEQGFGQYMAAFETKRLREAIRTFVDRGDPSSLTNLMFLSPAAQLAESDYDLIIAKVQTGVDIDKHHMDMIHLLLRDPVSHSCAGYFRSILENDEDPKLHYAIEFFSKSDVVRDIRYLEKILVGRKDFGDVLIKLFDQLREDYLGDPFGGSPPANSIEIGTAKIKALLNSKKIVEAFDVKRLSTSFMLPMSFLKNPNVLNWHPFLKETELYRAHYEA